MRSTLFRIISIIVLFVAVFSFSGLETAVASSSVAKADKSCCGSCDQDEDQSPSRGPASSPDCPLVLCLSADIVEPITLQVVSSETVPFFTFVPESIPDPFIKSIFHPPSLV